ncbi:MAG: lysophospholipid acyltransferase family protein [Chloroflexota bacterium]
MSALAAMGAAWLARVAAGPAVRFVAGSPPERQSIFFANHQSHLDFVVIWSALPPALRERTRPVAAREYWTDSPIRRYLSVEVFRAVLVDRSRPSLASLRGELEVLLAALDAGDSLILFPEGTRGTGETIGAFRGGLDFLARERPGVDLVPVFLDGLERIMPKGEFLPVPQLSRIVFGPPMHRQDGESKADFLARARDAVIALETA